MGHNNKLIWCETLDDTSYFFWCPACRALHKCVVPNHYFNGELSSPTFAPDILIEKYMTRCHFYISCGKIEFLGDCSHNLARMVVQLPNIPSHILRGAEVR